MDTFSALLAICAGNSPVPGEFPAQRPVTRSFHVFFDLRLNKPWSKQSWDWWFETLLCPLWRHCNVCFSSRQRWSVGCHRCTIPPDRQRYCVCVGHTVCLCKSGHRTDVGPISVDLNNVKKSQGESYMYLHCWSFRKRTPFINMV